MPTFDLPSGDDAVFGWKTGGAGGGSQKFQPPGAPVGGMTGAAAGGGGAPLGFDYSGVSGFDPTGERRKKLAAMFGGMPGQQVDPRVIQALLALVTGGR